MSIQNDYIQKSVIQNMNTKIGKTLHSIKVIMLESILVWMSKQNYNFEYLKR